MPNQRQGQLDTHKPQTATKRVSVEIPHALHAELKIRAVRDGMTMQGLVVMALRAKLRHAA